MTALSTETVTGSNSNTPTTAAAPILTVVSDWKMFGFDADDAADWADADFTAEDAHDWSANKFDIDTAIDWADTGFNAADARAWVRAGWTTREAAAFDDARINVQDTANWMDSSEDVHSIIRCINAGVSPTYTESFETFGSKGRFDDDED